MADEYSETGTGEKKGTPREVKESMRTGSPEEVKESVKKMVEKGVSAVAGALKGVADSSEKEDVPGTARSAVKQLGETTKELTKEGQKQYDTVKQEVQKGKGSTGMESTGTLGTTGAYGTTGGIESIPPAKPSTGITGTTPTTGFGSTEADLDRTRRTGLGSTTGTEVGTTGPESVREKDLSDFGTEENKLAGKKERKSEF